jgi:hypothetical protein
MKRELTEKLLKSFQRSDPYRSSLDHFMPIEFEGKKYCVATSAHHFIMIPETKENKLNKPGGKVVNFAGILKPLDLNIKFPVKSLVDAYDSIEIVERDITEECPSCDGEGTFEHCGIDYDCQYCDGDGNYKTGKKETVKDPDARLLINDKRIKPEFIKDIINVISQVDGKVLSVRYSAFMSIFELDGSILFGVMECVHESKDKTIFVK